MFAAKGEVRFAVGRRLGRRSTIWKLWRKGDDIYIASRMFGSDVKVSIHSSGQCQWSCTDTWVKKQEGVPNAARHIAKWNLIFPESTESLLAFRVQIPVSELRDRPAPTDKKKVLWVNGLHESVTAEFMIYITKESASDPVVGAKLPYQLVAYFRLANGRWVVLLVNQTVVESAVIAAAKNQLLEPVKLAGLSLAEAGCGCLFFNGGEQSSNGLLEVCLQS